MTNKRTPLNVQNEDGNEETDHETMNDLYDEIIHLSIINKKLENDNLMLYILSGASLVLNIIQVMVKW